MSSSYSPWSSYRRRRRRRETTPSLRESVSRGVDDDGRARHVGAVGIPNRISEESLAVFVPKIALATHEAKARTGPDGRSWRQGPPGRDGDLRRRGRDVDDGPVELRAGQDEGRHGVAGTERHAACPRREARRIYASVQGQVAAREGVGARFRTFLDIPQNPPHHALRFLQRLLPTPAPRKPHHRRTRH